MINNNNSPPQKFHSSGMTKLQTGVESPSTHSSTNGQVLYTSGAPQSCIQS